MPSGSYLQVNVLCPFYALDVNRPSYIQCEGIDDTNMLALKFRNKTNKNEYMKKYCMSQHYERCLLYQAAYEKYKNEKGE